MHIWNGEPALVFLGASKMHYNDYDTFFETCLKPLIHPDDWANYAAMMERGALLARFRRGEHTCSEEYRIRSRPTENAPYEWRNLNVRLSRDPITLRPKASCHVTDISPQKANEWRHNGKNWPVKILPEKPAGPTRVRANSWPTPREH